MGILSWIIFGLIAGLIAQLIMPGGGYGIVVTVILGIIGAVVGGWIASYFGGYGVSGFNIRSFVVAILGAILVIFIFKMITRATG